MKQASGHQNWGLRYAVSGDVCVKYRCPRQRLLKLFSCFFSRTACAAIPAGYSRIDCALQVVLQCVLVLLITSVACIYRIDKQIDKDYLQSKTLANETWAPRLHYSILKIHSITFGARTNRTKLINILFICVRDFPTYYLLTYEHGPGNTSAFIPVAGSWLKPRNTRGAADDFQDWHWYFSVCIRSLPGAFSSLHLPAAFYAASQPHGIFLRGIGTKPMVIVAKKKNGENVRPIRFIATVKVRNWRSWRYSRQITLNYVLQSGTIVDNYSDALDSSEINKDLLKLQRNSHSYKLRSTPRSRRRTCPMFIFRHVKHVNVLQHIPRGCFFFLLHYEIASILWYFSFGGTKNTAGG